MLEESNVRQRVGAGGDHDDVLGARTGQQDLGRAREPHECGLGVGQHGQHLHRVTQGPGAERALEPAEQSPRTPSEQPTHSRHGRQMRPRHPAQPSERTTLDQQLQLPGQLEQIERVPARCRIDHDVVVTALDLG